MPYPSPTTLLWFRDDLRVRDNPALAAALEGDAPVAAFYILEDGDELRPLGGAAKWWLAGSLRVLEANLKKLNIPLILRRGAAAKIVPNIAEKCTASAVLWNRRYTAGGIEIDTSLKEELKAQGLEAKSFSGSLLYEPWEVLTKSNTPFKVFTPFWRAARDHAEPRSPLPAPKPQAHAPKLSIKSDALEDWALAPQKPDWAGGLREEWTPGESGAHERLSDFLDEILRGYTDSRDRPDKHGTSRLSPHLRFGEISPQQVWHAVRFAVEAAERSLSSDAEKFLSELGWREFSYHLLYHFPKLATDNFNARFDHFPWRKDAEGLRAWQKGLTGYPIVDAGMRQLWQTGWMHNRVRMIAASFLIKDLLLDWRAGEDWFWDTLVDADSANNPASWQWVAGCGADAAPYFRVFNPVLQGEKFDPRGEYVRRFVPELAELPDSLIHKPWTADRATLERAGVRLGETYPRPIVDHAKARDRALRALKEIKDSD